MTAAHQVGDPYSCAQLQTVCITHLDLALELDFVRRQLRGSVTLTLDWKDPQADELDLDTDDLTIERVSAIGADGETRALEFTLAPAAKHLGSRLTIEAPRRPAQIRIAYATSPEAAGLQWFTPAQTADRSQPFMFSQSEATHARSWVPLQDSPAVRFTWTAQLRACDGVRIVMSAPNDAAHPPGGPFDFAQAHPVPSYLLAIAAGNLAVRETGPRSAVYAEPGVIASAAQEFEDTEKMIATAETLYGPYPWGRYDILVLPPSFPYGGMENPNMTFATPTVLVGDKSLVSLVAHELAHSWSGNLVTAARWRDIWLNEGITTYVQGRITEALYGRRQANEEILLATRNLQREIGAMPENSQRLAPEPGQACADDSLSDVPYHKGSWFMRTLEERFGRPQFDAWLKRYFEHFAWQSITTEQMLGFLKDHLLDEHPGKMSRDEVWHWIYDPGLPEQAPLPESPRFDAIDKGRSEFLADRMAAEELDAKTWNTQEWMYFLDGLPAETDLDHIGELDAAWRLTGTPNGEIGMRWYRLTLAAGSESVQAAAARHMTRIGRLHLIKPLYKACVKAPDGPAFAARVYARAKAGYHPLTRAAVERLLAEMTRQEPATGTETR